VKASPFSFVPDAGDSSRRLDDLVMARLPLVFRERGLDAVASRTKLRRMILDGAVSVAGKPVRVPAIKVKPGTVVTVYLDPARFAAEETPGDSPFECTPADILYEDEWLIAVDKPPGIPTEGSFLATRDSLHAAVQRFLATRDGGGLPYLGIPHRLDRDTSGVVLFPRRQDANAAIHQAFASRTAIKIYRALTVRPRSISGQQFEVSGRMARISPKSAPAKWGLVRSEGSPSSTCFSVEAIGTGGLVLRAEPRTGRTHQIRVHAASAGMPLYGDTLYGGPASLSGSPVPRVMLHAAQLSLPHPDTGRILTVAAPVPADFGQVMEFLLR
jgi:23S rRNA pseudouridine1911/1915/1917 synthase